MKTSVFFLFVFFSVSIMGKQKVDFKIEKTIVELEALRKKVTEASDTGKLSLNNEFKDLLGRLLHNGKSLTYDLSSLKSVSVLTSPQKNFRIYTWPLEVSPGNYDYYGFTQYLINNKRQELKVVELENSTFDMTHKDDKAYYSDQWKGGLYYSIVPSKKKNAKTFLLLGWDGFAKRSTKKMIEVISFTKKGEPVFGAPVLNFLADKPKKNFRVKQDNEITYQVKYRHEFEYSSKVSMMLRYDDDSKNIVFDHLAPMNPKMASVKATYVPDYSYDGLHLKKGKWFFVKNLDLRNESLPKGKKYKPSDVK